MVLSTGTPDGALQPETLRFARSLLEEAQSSEIVTRTLSVLDFLELIDEALDPSTRGQTLEQRRFLESEELAAQYLLLLENDGDTDDYQRFVDFERSALNLFLKVDSRSSSEVLRLREGLHDFVNRSAELPPGTEVEVLGTWLLFPKAMDGISRHMIQGLVAATVAILVLMTVSLGSLSLGLASVIPNLLPVLVCVGAMGWLGVPISFVTSITGCLALGLAVDDTAHVLGHLVEGNGLEDTYREVGPALLQTTLCLGVGFLVRLFSDFLPIVHLGIATALTLTVALLCDIFLLPSLLALFGWPLASGDEVAAPSLVEVSGTR